jgi:hypothetical protein
VILEREEELRQLSLRAGFESEQISFVRDTTDLTIYARLTR